MVAIDGPAGSGKSTTARLVARRLDYRHIDTGAMYRAVALKVLRAGVDPEDPRACGRVASATRIRFAESGDGQTVLCDGEDVTRQIRTPEVTGAVSAVSAHAPVRAAMVREQRRLAQEGGAVLEGRDIGTVVLPAADVKVYLVASTTVRARRRMKEMIAQGSAVSVEEVEKDIVRRDDHDSNRQTSPLRRAVGSVEVDTSDLTIDEQVDRVVEIARGAAARLAALAPRPGVNRYRRMRLPYRLGYFSIRVLLKLFFGLKIEHRSQVDFDENYIFASNHKSYADPPFVGSTLPREAHFIAKSSLFRNRWFAWLIRTYNAIPMRRAVFDRAAMNVAVGLLRQGHSLMIFPEGSRVSAGQLGKPRSGVGYLAIHSGTAVVPVFVSGTNRLRRCVVRRERLRVALGRPIRMAPDTRPEFDHNDGYRAFAEMVLEAIQALKTELEARGE